MRLWGVTQEMTNSFASIVSEAGVLSGFNGVFRRIS